MKLVFTFIALCFSLTSFALEPNSTWQSETIHFHPQLKVIIDSQMQIELQYLNGRPQYSRQGDITGFNSTGYYSIQAKLETPKQISTTVKVYKVGRTNFEIVEDESLPYLKVVEVQNYNEVSFVQKVYKLNP